MIKTLLISALCGLFAAGASAAVTTTGNQWQSKTGEGLDGSWSDVGHWKLGHIPQAGEYANFRSFGGSAVVTMPAGTYASPVALRVGPDTGTSVTLDYSQSVCTEKSFFVGTTPAYTQWLDIDSSKRVWLPGNNNGYTGVMVCISGVVIKAERPTATTGTLSFTGGSYNLYDPEGFSVTNNLSVFGNNAGMADTDVVFDGTTTRLPQVTLGGNTLDGCLNLQSGDHTLFGGLNFASGSSMHGTNTVLVGSDATVSNRLDVYFTSGDCNRLAVSGTFVMPESRYVAYQSAGGHDSVDILSGGLFTVPRGFVKINVTSGKCGTFNVDGGTLRVMGAGSDAYLFLNDEAGTLDFNLKDGLVNLTGTLGLLMPKGNTTLTVSGGELRSPSIYLGMRNTTQTQTLIQTGGLINQTGDNFNLSQSSANKNTCRLQLDGGVMVARKITKGAGVNGQAHFSANGGTLRAREANMSIICDLDSAKLGAKGLTIDTNDLDVKLPQAFTDADDAAGEGLLVKRGSTTLSVSAAASAPSRIRVEEGYLRFDEGANTATKLEIVSNACLIARYDFSATPFKSLTVGGNGMPGRLRVGKDAKLVVDGPLALSDVRIWLDTVSSTWEIGDVMTVLTTTAPISEANANAWVAALETNGSEDHVCRFTVEPSGTGSALKVTVVAPETVELRVDAPNVSSNITENLAYAQNDALRAVVAAGSQLNASGACRFGSFTKDGAGRMTLSNPANQFWNGVTLNEGLLYLPTLAALGVEATSATKLWLKGGTLEIGSAGTAEFGVSAEAGSKKAYVVKTDADVTFRYPTMTSGDLIKRGAGTLTYRVPGRGGALTFDNGTQPNGKTVTGSETIVFDADGTPPTDGYAGLNVAEGTLRIKGEGKTVTTNGLDHLVYVGLPVLGLAAQPGLVLEDCTITTAGSGQSFEFGDGVTQGKSDVRALSFAMTNAVCLNLSISRFADHASVPLTMAYTLDASRWQCNNFYPNRHANSKATLRATNGSRLSVSTVFQVDGDTDMVFDNSRFDGKTAAVSISLSGSAKLKLTFQKGAEFVSTYASGNTTVAFDDAFWALNTGTSKHTFQSAARTVEVRAGGVHLAPQAGDAWTFTAGFVPTNGGVVSVEGAGTVCFTNAAASNLRLAGSGTVADSRLTDLTICCTNLTAETPRLTFSNCTLLTRANVDLGRNSDRPLMEPFETITVGTFTGTHPDPSSFRLTGTGLANIHGAFVYDGDTLVVTPRRTGAFIFFR